MERESSAMGIAERRERGYRESQQRIERGFPTENGMRIFPKKMERGYSKENGTRISADDADDCNDTCSTAANRQVKGKAKVLLSNKN
jgi:hypothetical protein